MNSRYKVLLKRFVASNKDVYVILFLGIASAVLEIFITYALSKTLSSSSDKIDFFHNILILSKKYALISITCLLLIRIVISFAQLGLTQRMQRKLLLKFSSSIYTSIIKSIPLQDFSKKGPGFYFSLAGDESFKLSSAISSLITSGNLVITLVAYIAFLAYSSLVGFSFFFIFSFSSFSFGLLLFRKIKNNGDRQTELSRSANNRFNDGATNLKSIRSNNSENYFIEAYTNELQTYTNSLITNDFLSIILKFIPTIFIIIIFSAVLYYSPDTEMQGVILIGLIYFRLLPITGNLYSLVIKIVADIKSIVTVTDFINKQSLPEIEITSVNSIESIEFRDLSYGYDNKTLVKNLNLTFHKGKSYSISGASGIGKSTLFDILLKFKEDYSGQIRINDKPINDLTSLQLRKKIRLVEQSASIFNDSIRNNIMLGREDDQDLLSLINICELQDIFTEQNLDNKLDFKGTNLSGGQKQRLSLLRSIILKPSVIVLDETFAGIDSVTKEKIISKLKNYFNDGIIICITHDQDIINQFDINYDIKGN